MYWFELSHTVICNLFDVQLFIEGREQKNYTDVSLKVINSLFQCEFGDISNSTLLAFSKSPFRRRSRHSRVGLYAPKNALRFQKLCLVKLVSPIIIRLSRF